LIVKSTERPSGARNVFETVRRHLDTGEAVLRIRATEVVLRIDPSDVVLRVKNSARGLSTDLVIFRRTEGRPELS
jgi:hypothetical protein